MDVVKFVTILINDPHAYYCVISPEYSVGRGSLVSSKADWDASITQTHLCNILQYFMAVKIIFR